MRQHFRKLRKPLRGECKLAFAYFLVSALGSLIAFLSVVRMNNKGPFAEVGLFEWWVIVAGATGAVLALKASRKFLGQSGPMGAVNALWGGLYLSLVGSLIAGTLVLPVYGTMFGPFSLAITLIGAPILAAAWLSSVLLVHVMLVAHKDELQHAARLMRLHSARD